MQSSNVILGLVFVTFQFNLVSDKSKKKTDLKQQALIEIFSLSLTSPRGRQ
jgi:hypothetical protein